MQLNNFEKQNSKSNKKKPIFKRWWFWILVVALLIGAISSANEDPQKAEIGNNSETTSAQNTPIETTAPKPFTVHDTVEVNDVYVTLESFTESAGGNLLTPADGNVFILCEFTIENKSNKDIAVSSMLSFEAYADDYSTAMSIMATSSAEKAQLDGTIAPDKKMNGVIGFEVPRDWSVFEIRYTPDVLSKEIIFICEK